MSVFHFWQNIKFIKGFYIMLALPYDVRLLILEQFKRDLNFRYGRETAVRFRPKDRCVLDHDVYEMRDGHPWEYSTEECMEALQDLNFCECFDEIVLGSMEYYLARIAYLAKCPFARYRFKNELIDGVRIRSSRMVQRFVELHGIGGEVTRMIGTVMPTGMLP